MCLESTFAPAATAFQINALHCVRLCAMLVVAHICPTACINQIRIRTDASELLVVTLTAMAMSEEVTMSQSRVMEGDSKSTKVSSDESRGDLVSVCLTAAHVALLTFAIAAERSKSVVWEESPNVPAMCGFSLNLGKKEALKAMPCTRRWGSNGAWKPSVQWLGPRV